MPYGIKYLSDLIVYPLTLTSYSTATIRGFFAKTNRAQSVKYLIKGADHAQLLFLDLFKIASPRASQEGSKI